MTDDLCVTYQIFNLFSLIEIPVTISKPSKSEWPRYRCEFAQHFWRSSESFWFSPIFKGVSALPNCMGSVECIIFFFSPLTKWNSQKPVHLQVVSLFLQTSSKSLFPGTIWNLHRYKHMKFTFRKAILPATLVSVDRNKPCSSSNEKDEIARWREMPASIFSMILILGI